MCIGELAQNCATELNEFKNHIQNACLSCLELFRLAFLHETNEAFEHIYLLYEMQVGRWVELHSWFPQTKENTDYFVNDVWAKFYYATHGAKFRQFDSIPQIMAYHKVIEGNYEEWFPRKSYAEIKSEQ